MSASIDRALAGVEGNRLSEGRHFDRRPPRGDGLLQVTGQIRFFEVAGIKADQVSLDLGGKSSISRMTWGRCMTCVMGKLR